MTPDFNDIIFERLNKEYGAYILRKRYASVLTLSITLAIILGCAVVIVPYLRLPDPGSDEIFTSRYVMTEYLLPPDEHGGTPPPPTPSVPTIAHAAAGKATPEHQYIAPTVVDTILPVEKQVISSADSIKSDIEGKGTEIGEGDENGAASSSLSGAGTGEGGDGGAGTGHGLSSKVDIMPLFRGGDINKFRAWVQKKTRYPSTATMNGIHGQVYITFIVENDGSVSNVKVAKGVDPLIDKEALKAVASSPKWTPGRQRGLPVRVAYIIMLNFRL